MLTCLTGLCLGETPEDPKCSIIAKAPEFYQNLLKRIAENDLAGYQATPLFHESYSEYLSCNSVKECGGNVFCAEGTYFSSSFPKSFKILEEKREVFFLDSIQKHYR